MTRYSGRQEGQEEKVIQFLLRGRMMLYSDTSRFVSFLFFFEIFNSQNSNFQGAKSLKNCIFRPELPPHPPDPQSWFVSKTKQMSQ